MNKVNLAEKFALISDHWHARVAGELNGLQVKLVKLKGEFMWHHHDHEDELFLVIKGRLRIRLKTGDIVIEPGEFLIVPRGVEHMPVAEVETEIVLFEPASTLNTGNLRNERTVENLKRI